MKYKMIFLIFLSFNLFSQVKVSFYYDKGIAEDELIINQYAETCLDDSPYIKLLTNKIANSKNFNLDDLDWTAEYIVSLKNIYLFVDGNKFVLGCNMLFINPTTAEVVYLIPAEGSGNNVKNAGLNFRDKILSEIKSINFNKGKNYLNDEKIIDVTVKYKNENIHNNKIPNSYWCSKLTQSVFNKKHLRLIDNDITPAILEEVKKSYAGLSNNSEVAIINIDSIIELTDIYFSNSYSYTSFLGFPYSSFELKSKLNFTSVEEKGRTQKYQSKITRKKGASISFANTFFTRAITKEFNDILDVQFPSKHVNKRIWLKKQYLNETEKREGLFERKQVAINASTVALYNALENKVSSDNRFILLDSKQSKLVADEWSKRFSGITENSTLDNGGILKDVWYIIKLEGPKLYSKRRESKDGTSYMVYWYEVYTTIIDLKNKNQVRKDVMYSNEMKNNPTPYDFSDKISEFLKKSFPITEQLYIYDNKGNKEIIFRGKEIGIEKEMNINIYDLKDNKKIGSMDIYDSTVGYSLAYPIYFNRYPLSTIRNKELDLVFVENYRYDYGLALDYELYFNPFGAAPDKSYHRVGALINYYDKLYYSLGIGVSMNFATEGEPLAEKTDLSIIGLNLNILQFDLTLPLGRAFYWVLSCNFEGGCALGFNNYTSISFATSIGTGLKFRFDENHSISLLAKARGNVNCNILTGKEDSTGSTPSDSFFSGYDYIGSGFGVGVQYLYRF